MFSLMFCSYSLRATPPVAGSNFHWWPNHRNLNNHLFRDPRWAVVYYDETSIIAVRKEGNEDVIARAQAAFPAARAETERILMDDTKSWQYPVARARGLLVYTSLLQSIGKRDEAAKFQSRWRELSGAS